ncbi:MAG: carbamate kinase [Chloroflexi bacterium]|nr:carbamate kinase [Chloroflexota bacterium]
MGHTALVALGGHAILRKDEPPTIARQFLHTRRAMRHLLQLVQQGWGLVLTHGNGPQVGHILIRSELARGKAYPVPLSVAVAESEGEIGYVIQQSLYNELAAAGLVRPIVTVLTQVVVDKDDPAFQHPTKPIGPFYPDEDAVILRRKGWPLAYAEGHGWRRVVASPRPVRIIEGEIVGRLAEQEVIVIAAGGGGIPVVEERGRLRGVDAVIDKDLASAVLAVSIHAELLLLLTDVRKAALDYGGPGHTDLDMLTVAQAEQYAREGHFPAGSMGPKVEGAVQFLKAGGRRAIITTPEALGPALDGLDGTVLVP